MREIHTGAQVGHRLPRDKYIILFLLDSKLTPKWLYNGLIQQLGGTQKFYCGDAKIELLRQIETLHSVACRTKMSSVS